MGCSKPNCDCLEKEEQRIGGPVKYGYPCLYDKTDFSELKSKLPPSQPSSDKVSQPGEPNDEEYLLRNCIYLALIGVTQDDGYSIPAAVRQQIEDKIVRRYQSKHQAQSSQLGEEGELLNQWISKHGRDLRFIDSGLWQKSHDALKANGRETIRGFQNNPDPQPSQPGDEPSSETLRLAEDLKIKGCIAYLKEYGVYLNWPLTKIEPFNPKTNGYDNIEEMWEDFQHNIHTSLQIAEDRDRLSAELAALKSKPTDGWNDKRVIELMEWIGKAGYENYTTWDQWIKRPGFPIMTKALLDIYKSKP